MIKVTHIDHMGSDLSVVNAARVSFGKESLWNWSKELDSDTGDGRTLRERDTKLIKYLAEHKHMSVHSVMPLLVFISRHQSL